jgi:hypothetical protein
MCERVQMGRRTAFLCMGGPVYTLTVRGTPMTFEMHPYCGPIVLGKNGDPLAVQPHERHPFWDAFEQWQQKNTHTPHAGGTDA